MIDDERIGRESQRRSRNSTRGWRETRSGSGPSPVLPARNRVPGPLLHASGSTSSRSLDVPSSHLSLLPLSGPPPAPGSAWAHLRLWSAHAHSFLSDLPARWDLVAPVLCSQNTMHRLSGNRQHVSIGFPAPWSPHFPSECSQTQTPFLPPHLLQGLSPTELRHGNTDLSWSVVVQRTLSSCTKLCWAKNVFPVPLRGLLK